MAIRKWIDEADTVVFCVSANKKVKNARKVYYDETWFRSKLEYYVYRRLKELGINFEYEKNRFTLIHPFEYQGEKVRPMTYKPDFVGKTFIIEAKGNATDAWKVRVKLVKRRFAKDYPHYKYYQVSSMKAFEEIIDEIQLRETNYKNIA